MKRIQLMFFIVVAMFQLKAQTINVNYTINTNLNRKNISPFIYGACNGGYDSATFVRQGGNRMTGYNWENNASNAGADYFHQSDNYLTWIMGINAPQDTIPGIVMTAFHDSALAHHAMSALTLPMAGYVAKDKLGTSVSLAETAPSARWLQVVNKKPSAFSLSPNQSDNVIYVDECMNYLIHQYGLSSTSTGIKSYLLDNESALWISTHPRIHPLQPGIAEHTSKSVALAKTIKDMDSNAKVFGPESYGFAEYTQYQSALDWSNYSASYPMYVSVFLDSMKKASDIYGKRLLDVFSVHWYPDVNVGSIYSSDTSLVISKERMQVPRTLWDSTYVSDSWIGQWFSANLPILPYLKSQVNTYYPGTAMGITEYDYGAEEHISGGLAQVDALGAFGKTGIGYASKWGTIGTFPRLAYQLFRDDNGVDERFGATGIYAESNNHFNSSIYCSLTDTINQQLHIIVTNKNYDSTLHAVFNITSSIQYDSIQMISFNRTSSSLTHQAIASSALSGNQLTYNLQPLTAYHFILSKKGSGPSSVTTLSNETNLFNIFPNPANDVVHVEWSHLILNDALVQLCSMDGKVIQTILLNKHQQSIEIPVMNLPRGNYLIKMIDDNHVYSKQVQIVNK